MSRRNGLEACLPAGALAGLAGGLVFGAAMIALDYLPTVASIVRSDSSVAGFALHMLIAAVVGAGFAALVRDLDLGAGETVFWGLAYSVWWWFLGPLTLLSLLLGESLAWDVPSAQAAFPSLLGHLLYGGTLALTLVLLNGERRARPSPGAIARGVIAGVSAAWLIGVLLAAQGRLASFTAMDAGTGRPALWLLTLFVGALAGAGYAVLYPRPAGSTGAGLVRGTMYGFLWWAAVGRTILPALAGDGLPWSVDETRAAFGSLIGYLLMGGALVLCYRWLNSLWRLLFSDEIGAGDSEGAGTQGLRAIGGGAMAGIAGGLLFTIVMVKVGFLPTVASLVGAGSETAGFFVHLAISILIGAAYGLLFRRQAYDSGSALGWGVSYGFVWWLLGPLTLLPLLLGRAPEWTAPVASGLIASLVGHIAYGAGLGIVVHRIEARVSPWWIPRARADEARVRRRTAAARTAAPALWALVVAVALTLPVVLGTEGPGAALYGMR